MLANRMTEHRIVQRLNLRATMKLFRSTFIACSTLGVLLSDSGLTKAGSHGPSPWHCPYQTDGNCAPRRQLYGHYAPKWQRWPGVDDTRYRSMSDRGPRQYPEPPADTGPRFTPGEMILPPSNLPTLDEAPRPPVPDNGGDAMGPPSLFGDENGDPSPREPSILAPPEENVLDELLPPETTKPPAPRTAAPEELLPKSPDSAPDAAPESPAEQPKVKPFDGDPFLDDPLFDDDAPAPPDSSSAPNGAPELQGPKISAGGPDPKQTSATWRNPTAEQGPADATMQLGGKPKPTALGFGNRRTAAMPHAAKQVAHWEQADEPTSESNYRPNVLRTASAKPLALRKAMPRGEVQTEPTPKPAETAPELKWRANPLR
jgi:hypothetical protein